MKHMTQIVQIRSREVVECLWSTQHIVFVVLIIKVSILDVFFSLDFYNFRLLLTLHINRVTNEFIIDFSTRRVQLHFN